MRDYKKWHNTAIINLCDIISKNNLHFLKSRTVTDILNELLCLIDAKEIFDARADILSELKNREALMSTGIGQGVALPHTGVKNIKNIYIKIGVSQSDVDWRSFDKKPVRIVIMILFPTQKREDYLNIIAKLSNTLKEDCMRKAIMECCHEKELIDVFFGK
jgi:mannitol/fructose-specific phosphotransferase system IIA component (Ntr-type)